MCKQTPKRTVDTQGESRKKNNISSMLWLFFEFVKSVAHERTIIIEGSLAEITSTPK